MTKTRKTVPARFEEYIDSLQVYSGYFTFTSGEYKMNLDERDEEDRQYLPLIEWLDESKRSFSVEDIINVFKEGDLINT